MSIGSAFSAALAPLAGAALTCAACYSAGIFIVSRWKLRLSRVETTPLAFLLGAASLHLAVFAVMAAHAGYPPVLAGVLLVAIALGGWARRHVAPVRYEEFSIKDLKITSFPRLATILSGLIAGAYVVFYFVVAWAPEVSPDGSGYHLEIVGRYVREHGFSLDATNMYAGLSEGVETLFIPAFALGGHSAAALVHLAFTCMLGWLIYAYGVRLGKPWVGAAAALLTFASPVVGVAGSSAYIDVALAAVVFSVFYWLEIWDASRDSRLLVPIGLMGGYGYAAKYTAVAMLLYALGFVAWRAKKIKPVLTVAAFAALMAAPWMFKDAILLHNPIAPFGNALFRNPYMFPLPEAEWAADLRQYGVENKWALPLEVTLWGDKTQGVIGAVFLLAPLVLLALRYRAGRRLLVPGFLFVAVYFSNIGTRFLIPCLPFFSLALALALEHAGPLLALLVLTHAVVSWPTVLDQTPAGHAWRLVHFPLDAALRRVPEKQFVERHDPAFELSGLVERFVPKSERVFLFSGIPESYTSRELMVAFQSGEGLILKDFLDTAWIGLYQPTRVLVYRFPPRDLRRVRLLQTEARIRPVQWSVNEVRFFHGGSELARRPEWRLRAFPNPWSVQLAFDNSPVTRWRSWEQPSPGMYIDVDFGRNETIDEVHVETSPDTSSDRVELQSMSEGRWEALGGTAEARAVPVPGSLKKAATFELAARGIHYLVVQNGDFGSDIFRDDPEGWGLSVVAKGASGILYQVKH